MFIGHFAVGLAWKRVTPRISLAILFAAVQLADLLWPVFLATGLERVRIDPGNTPFVPLDFVSYPLSHSLALLLVWGIAFGYVYRSVTRDNMTVIVVIAALVVSHWFLDVLTHRPDMPLYPGGPKVGLGLWNFVTATIVVESAMYAASLWVYVRATRARDATGRWAFVSLAVFLALAYVANVMSGPPPSVAAIWILGLVGGIVILAWSWWADAHRVSRTSRDRIPNDRRRARTGG